MSNRIRVSVSLILGIGLLAGSGYFFADTRQLITKAEKVPGVVSGFERRSSKGGSTDYAVIEFTTTSGEIHRFTTSGPGGYVKGSAVDVLFETGNPTKARVDDFLELWLGSLALGAFGLLCVGVGLGTWLYDRARLKTTAERSTQ
jgi:Protein of unknown function (DUF3592)